MVDSFGRLGWSTRLVWLQLHSEVFARRRVAEAVPSLSEVLKGSKARPVWKPAASNSQNEVQASSESSGSLGLS